MSYEKPFWLKDDSIEPKAFDLEEYDANMRRAARQVFLPKRIRELEAKLARLEEKKNHPKGFEGLTLKKTHIDLSRYSLTDRQEEVLSLQLEYGLSKAEIAKRLRIHRSTVDQHIKAAGKRMNGQWRANRRKPSSHADSED
jgi:DNA-binding NarL/FixJ family response regulator